METYLPVVCLAALLAAFFIFFLLGKDKIDLPGENSGDSLRGGLASVRHSTPQRPAPIPENPDELQKLLQFLEKSEIYFEEFGKICRIHGRLIYGIKVEDETKDTVWQNLTAQLPQLGYWPLFVSEEAFAIQDQPEEIAFSHYSHPEDLIRRAKKHPVEAYFTKIEDLLADRLDQIEKGEYWGDEVIPDPENPQTGIRWITPGSLIAFVPTPHSWQVPAYFAMGDALSLKDEEVLVVLRHWEELYGTKLYYFTPMAMALKTERRPASKEEALRLAFEQSDFCGDLYQNQYASPEELAADLMHKDTWEFLWGV